MRRWTLNILAVISLLLCLAMVILWVRSSYRVMDYVRRNDKWAISLSSVPANYCRWRNRYGIAVLCWSYDPRRTKGWEYEDGWESRFYYIQIYASEGTSGGTPT